MRKQLTIDALPLLFSGGISNYVSPLVHHLVTAAQGRWQTEAFFRLGLGNTRWRRFRQYCRRYPEIRSNSCWTALPDKLTAALWKHGIPVPIRRKTMPERTFIATTEMVPASTRDRIGWIVYDFTQYHLAQFFNIHKGAYLEKMARLAGRTDFIIAISKSTKRDVCRLIDYPEDRVCVVYPGAPEWRDEPGVDAGVVSHRRPYVFYLGSLSLSKNVDGMLRVFSRVVHDFHIDIDIVLTGKDFCGADFWASLVRQLGIEGRVHITGWIPTAQRDRYLAEAMMLWHFSWYEGFGLPVLEAAARGIPVVHTNRGAVPEILQNPEQAIDPDDEADAAACIGAALSSQQTLTRWGRLGSERAKRFSWQESANKLLGWLTSTFH